MDSFVIVFVVISLPFMLLGTIAHFDRRKSLKLHDETNGLLRELIADIRASRAHDEQEFDLELEEEVKAMELELDRPQRRPNGTAELN